MADVKEQGYKGFAYTKGNEKPYVTFGNSRHEIISRLQGYNRARSRQMQYTSVNIGQLNDQTNKYENYKKYDVTTGKDITPIYLKLPSLTKDEFKMLTTQLKEDGAKYNSFKKAWYITPDMKDKFEKYIESDAPVDNKLVNVNEILQESEKETSELVDQVLQWQPKHNMVGFSDTITVRLEDERQIDIKAESLPQEYWSGSAFDKLKILDDVLDDVLAEQSILPDNIRQNQARVIDREDYVISIPKEIENNECTVFFKDGRDPVHVYGDQLGVSLPQIPTDEAEALIDNYMLNQNEFEYQPEKFDVVKGNEIDGYLLKEQGQEYSFFRINATVDDSDGIKALMHYKNLPEDSAYEVVRTDHVFTKQQKEAAEPVLKCGRSLEEIKMICNAEYSPAQMEEMVSGIRDGLREQQVKVYADPQIPSWKMDMYRIGLQHGIPADRIATLCEQSEDWIGARTVMTDVIKEHRLELAEQITKAGFKAAPETVRKLEQLNHLTGRENTMKDICKAFKEHTYKDQPKLDELVKDIGREFQMQEVAAMQQPIR